MVTMVALLHKHDFKDLLKDLQAEDDASESEDAFP